MKNNALFFLTLVTLLLIALGVLFYQYQSGKLVPQKEDAVEELVIPDLEENVENEIPPELDEQEMPISPTSTSGGTLEAIEEELNRNVILDEDL